MWQDEARIGQLPMGQTWHAPAGKRTDWAYIICPAKGKAPGWSCPDTDAMAAHLIEISAAVDPGAQAV